MSQIPFPFHPIMGPLVVALRQSMAVTDDTRLDAVPLADVYRRDDAIVLHLDLPGVDEESLEVKVEGDVLTVSAERRHAPEPGDRVLISERPFGQFRRSFRFASALNAGEVSADLAGGVLTVTASIASSEAATIKVTRRGNANAEQ